MKKWNARILHSDFYDRNPAEVAPDLLGKLLIRNIGGTFLVGKIIETEAYLAEGDMAAHGFKGQTSRNASLYKTRGHAYVHAMRHHFLLDAVTEDATTPSSVLIRSIEGVAGLEGRIIGPGKLCKALHITRALDGIDMTDPKSELCIAQGEHDTAYRIVTSLRIGISPAKNLPLRFEIS